MTGIHTKELSGKPDEDSCTRGSADMDNPSDTRVSELFREEPSGHLAIGKVDPFSFFGNGRVNECKSPGFS